MIFTVFATTVGDDTVTVSAEPQLVLSIPEKTVVEDPRGSISWTLVTNGALYVSYTATCVTSISSSNDTCSHSPSCPLEERGAHASALLPQEDTSAAPVAWHAW